MNILKNKHLILAMFVAPVLAIIAYFSVDYVVSEKPQAAQPGSSYKLAAKSNCRYKSGTCTLKNGDVEMHINAQHIGEQQIRLTLQTELPLQQAVLSYVIAGSESVPQQLSADDGDWVIDLSLAAPDKTVLRIAFNIAGIMYYAETVAVFVDYETVFPRDNFSE